MSRRNPHFNKEALERSLPALSIAYDWRGEELGGRRSPDENSRHTAWRKDPFRGYADHMDTEEFGAALAELVSTAARAPTTIMCAEAVPWRCHRRLITDALLARGMPVMDIIGPGGALPARLSEHALPQADGGVIYPARLEVQEELFGG